MCHKLSLAVNRTFSAADLRIVPIILRNRNVSTGNDLQEADGDQPRPPRTKKTYVRAKISVHCTGNGQS